MPVKIVTPAGLKKYQDELDLLKRVKRREIAERVKAAKEQGDISENAEYHAAKDEQAHIEGRIEELESLLKTVQVVKKESKNGKVGIGSKITVKIADQKIDYEIVGANEADPENGKISNESAVGSALIGKNKGDKVKIEIPSGIVEYEILEVK